jgi:hypothetical protein
LDFIPRSSYALSKTGEALMRTEGTALLPVWASNLLAAADPEGTPQSPDKPDTILSRSARDTTISGTITSTVTLGTDGYSSPLTITPTGAITPTAPSATALVVPASVADAIVLNQGNIVGSAGALGKQGGTGVQFASRGELTNTGNISGGAGGFLGSSSWGAGGVGVNIAAGSTVTNSGTVTGGLGRGAAAGGASVNLASGGTLTNTGVIRGGQGGSAGVFGEGAGGIGVNLLSGGTLINSGTIAGGNGGASRTYPNPGFGAGGAGVFLNGGTLINSGTVAGGGGRPSGAAVQFGAVAATLVVDPGAVFNGLVVANAAVADVLTLAGTTAGTLSGLGTSFTNFHTITVGQSAQWTLTGTNSLAAGSNVQIGASGKLTNSGSLNIGGPLHLSGAGSFTNTGTVAMIGAGEADIGTTFINSAAVSVGSGKMEFLSTVGGTGTIGIAAKAAAELAGGAAATQTVSFQQPGGGELDLAKPTTFLGTIANFGTLDKIDLLSAPATSLSFAAGKLTVLDGSTKVATLAFSGSYQTANFALGSDSNGGSLITYHT